MAKVSCFGSRQATATWAGGQLPEKTLARAQTLDRYQPQFDGLRALAVLTVMVDHFSADVPNFPLPDWIHLGTTGVRLFLVLSGYFITASLRRARDRMETNGLSAGRAIRAFYWRRFLRIAPAYVVFTGIALILISAQSATIGPGFLPAQSIG
jgi:peptidoglycan/LPS O-acetylase OafA/YrhL